MRVDAGGRSCVSRRGGWFRREPVPTARAKLDEYVQRDRREWNPDAAEGRVCTVTRGLQTYDADGNELIPSRWYWKTIRTDDRRLTSPHRQTLPPPAQIRRFDDAS